ncbi:hypothetical protein D3C78_1490790 [compost metagenome]
MILIPNPVAAKQFFGNITLQGSELKPANRIALYDKLNGPLAQMANTIKQDDRMLVDIIHFTLHLDFLIHHCCTRIKLTLRNLFIPASIQIDRLVAFS